MFSVVVIQLFFFIVIFLLPTWYFYFKFCFNYWKKKGVPTITPMFPTGNILKPIIGQENLFVTITNFYDEFKKKGHRHGGLYFLNGPVYLPVDPEIVKSILTTDFEHFVDRGVFVDENYPLSNSLFSIRGSKWRNLRNKLSPTFTSGKLKTMYEIFIKMTEVFVNTVDNNVRENKEVNIKHISSRFTADLIFSTAFGLEGTAMKNPNGRLASIIEKFFQAPSWNFFIVVITNGFQNPGNLFKAVLLDRTKEHFFRNLLEKTIKDRDDTNNKRRDFLQLLLEVRDKEGLNFNEILAQCFVFFLAGFETSSQTMSYCFHELAHNQDIQDKLRNEIYENLGKDFRKFTYEDIFKLPYLDKVFNETLRKYPVLGYFNRICVKQYQVPGTDVIIEEGTPVLIPVLGLQRDPEYFPDPMKFNPERFSENQTHPPFTFLPFGDGPRFCIGARYGKLQTKLGIASLLSQFKFLPSSATPREIKFDTCLKTLVMVPSEGITVTAVKLNKENGKKVDTNI